MDVLANKVILITGAAKGLGRAYALDAAREGAVVVVNDIDARVEGVAAEIVAAGGRAIANRDSVTSWEGAKSIVETTVDNFGRVDGLVNNAGILHVGQAWEETESRIRDSFDINVLGSIFVGTHAIKVMVEQGYGSIVNNSSSGHLGAPGRAVYAASKGALASLTYAWATDLEPHGIRVNALSSVADTEMSRQNATVLDGMRLPSPEENAPIVTYLLSDLSEGVSGQVFHRFQDGFMVLRHPEFSEHFAPVDEISAIGVARAFDSTLRAGLQRYGWYGPNGKDFELPLDNNPSKRSS